MKQIKLNNTVKLDLQKLIAGKMLLQAGSGGGKSYAIRRILEQSFGEIPHLILDTEGEFSSLREKYDYILIGKGFDIGADPRTAALLALRLWEERVSAIIDLYELSPWDRQLFVKNFVDALINAPKKLWKPVLLVIDEAHEYAPESDKSDSGRALHLLASKGRKRQIGAIFATQRISSLSKNIVASCKNKLIGYASETNDVKRAAFELGFTPAEARGLRDLDPGEFYAFGPALTKEVTKIKIGEVKTSHEEQNNAGGLGHVAPASAKVKAALAKLADLPQAAAEEARTIAELKQEVARLKRETSRPVIDPDATKKITDKAFALGYESAKHNEREVKKIKDILYQKLLKSHGNIFRALEALSRDIDIIQSDEKNYVGFSSAVPTRDDTPIRISRHDPGFAERTAPRRGIGTYIESTVGLGTPMGTGERQVLIAIAQHDGMSREHITVQTGFKRSTRDAYIQRLMAKGFIQITPGSGEIVSTQAGTEALGNDYEPLPTGPELLAHLLGSLPEGEAKILNALRESTNYLTRDELSEMTGFKRSTRDAYIQRLAARQLVQIEKQTVKISDHLL